MLWSVCSVAKSVQSIVAASIKRVDMIDRQDVLLIFGDRKRYFEQSKNESSKITAYSVWEYNL